MDIRYFRARSLIQGIILSSMLCAPQPVCCGRSGVAFCQRVAAVHLAPRIFLLSTHAPSVFSPPVPVSVPQRIVNEEERIAVPLPLRQIGFHYAGRFSPEFTIDSYTPDGKLLMLVVSPEGEYAYALRREWDGFDHYLGEKIYYRLLELNPFIRNPQRVECREGYCKMLFIDDTKTAYLGWAGDLALTVSRRGYGLGAVLLQIALDEARKRRIREVHIFSSDYKVISFYERFGFKKVSPDIENTSLVLKLDEQNEAYVFESLEDVCGYYGLGLIDVRGGQPRFIESLAKRMVGNKIVREYLEWEEEQAMGRSLLSVIRYLIREEKKRVRKIIAEWESKDMREKRRLGRSILQEFNRRVEFREEASAFTLDWKEFAGQKTLGEYDLRQLLSHNIGIAYSYFQEASESPDLWQQDEFATEAHDLLRSGIITLLAIELAGRTDTFKNNISADGEAVFLPKRGEGISCENTLLESSI